MPRNTILVEKVSLPAILTPSPKNSRMNRGTGLARQFTGSSRGLKPTLRRGGRPDNYIHRCGARAKSGSAPDIAEPRATSKPGPSDSPSHSDRTISHIKGYTQILMRRPWALPDCRSMTPDDDALKTIYEHALVDTLGLIWGSMCIRRVFKIAMERDD